MEKYYTEKELITVKELEKRWHIDTEELARIVVENSLTIFCSKYARERKCCIFFVGFEIQYEKSIDGIFECLETFTDGYKIIKNKEGNSESVDIFLLFSDIQKYETNKPFLVGDPVEADYRAAVDKTIRDKEALPPLPPALNGGHSEEQGQGEIARLKEQLAGHAAQAQGVDASQAEALKLEREAHARTREDLAAAQGRLTELERQLAGVQEELDATKAKLKEALEEHGVCSYVIRERQAGTREEDIAAGLLKRGLNGSQAGAWIYSQEWGSKDARKKSFQRLTGTA